MELITKERLLTLLTYVKRGEFSRRDIADYILRETHAQERETREEIHKLYEYVIRNTPAQPKPLPKGDISMTTQEAQELAIIKQAFTDVIAQIATLNQQVTDLKAAAANVTVPQDVQDQIDAIQTIAITAAPSAPAEVAAAAATLAASSGTAVPDNSATNAPGTSSAPSGS